MKNYNYIKLVVMALVAAIAVNLFLIGSFFIDFIPLKNISSKLISDGTAPNIVTLSKVLFSFFTQSQYAIVTICILCATSLFLFKKNAINYQILGILLLIFNPFLYTRIISGQIGIALGIVVISTYLYLELKKEENSKKRIIIAFFIFFLGTIQYHILVIILVLFFFIQFYYNKQKLQYILITLLLISVFIQGMFSSNVLTQIDQTDAEFFSPKLTQDVPTIAKIAGMWGFWRESAYITTYSTLPLWLWYTILLIIVGTFLIGYFYNPSKDRKQDHFFFILWWIGLLLATGISHPITKPLFDILFNYVPFFSGFRDSHKFVVFIVLAYAYFCPKGIDYLSKLWNFTYAKQALTLVFIAALVTFTYPLLPNQNGALWGQVHPVDYPISYEETNQFLTQNNITGHIVYLPWELYLTYNWSLPASTDGRIPVPINELVKPIIVTGSGQWGGQNELQYNITRCVNNQSIDCLGNSGVQYIIKDNCAFFPDNYSWVNQTITHQDSCTQIYEINHMNTDSQTIHIPLRFIIGSIISFLTLIGCLMYLYITRKTTQK